MSGERRSHSVVLFADMSGSVTMYAKEGDTAGYRLNAACLQLLDGCVKDAGGKVVRRAGDGVLAVFENADDALHAAAAMQLKLHGDTTPLRGRGVRIRAGICSGNVMHGRGDIYGDSVNVAARLSTLAGPDEVLIAADVYEALGPELQSSTRPIEDLALKGRPDAVSVYEFLWRHEDVTVAVKGRPNRVNYLLTLMAGEREYILDSANPRLTIGRAPENDIVLNTTFVSRNHADIVLRGDKFVLTDRSTNGTFVIVDHGPVIRACREEVQLVESGRIAPGQSTSFPISYRITNA